MPEPQQQAVSHFLRAYFADLTEGDYLRIWTKHQADRTRYTQSIEHAAQIAADLAQDVYFCVGTCAKELPPEQRGTAKDTHTLYSLWADIDVMNDRAHAARDLPPTLEAAGEIVKAIPFRPSAVVQSGYGLQCYWMLKEPWTLDSDQEHTHAAQLSATWHRYLASVAGRFNWRLDQVGNLDRVLRLPGTLNCKIPDSPRLARLSWAKWDKRINASEIQEFLESEGFDLTAARQVSTKSHLDYLRPALRLKLTADPPAAALSTALKNRHFQRTWERRRTDMQDQSSSAYCQSLANQAARLDWSPQQIADLMCAYQRTHRTRANGAPEDGPRRNPTWYLETVHKAMEAAGRTPAQLAMKGTAESAKRKEETPGQDNPSPKPRQSSPPPPPPADRREDLKAKLSERLGVTIHRLVRYNTRPSFYELMTAAGKIDLEGAENITSQTKFRARIYDLGRYIAFSRDEWPDIAQALRDICEDAPDSGDEGIEATMRDWLMEYLRRPHAWTTDPKASRKRGTALVHEDRVSIHLPDLYRWISQVGSADRSIRRQTVIVCLQKLGAERYTHSMKDPDTSISLWRLPETAAYWIDETPASSNPQPVEVIEPPDPQVSLPWAKPS